MRRDTIIKRRQLVLTGFSVIVVLLDGLENDPDVTFDLSVLELVPDARSSRRGMIFLAL